MEVGFDKVLCLSNFNNLWDLNDLVSNNFDFLDLSVVSVDLNNFFLDNFNFLDNFLDDWDLDNLFNKLFNNLINLNKLRN